MGEIFIAAGKAPAKVLAAFCPAKMMTKPMN